MDGIPVLLAGDADDFKSAQARYFDDPGDSAFEIARPHSGPALYDWLLAERFRRSTSSLGIPLRDAVVLTVCGGSGMDAHFFAEAGASVISADISLGAARRVQERARRHGLDLVPIVADAERLPFADEAVDVVSVHDGLHHLEDPFRALDEMARVASRAVVIAEPASAALTNVAVRFGLALRVEESGNQVRRLRGADVESILRRNGLEVVSTRRFAMYYRHVPGQLSRLFSRPLPFAAVRIAYRCVNALAGRFGNKLAVQAVRDRSTRR